MNEESIPEKPIPASITNIQNVNWAGSIPVILSLSPSSLSSPTAPRPLHKMIRRMTYIHLALEEEVLQLFEYAPVTMGGSVVVREEPPDNEDEQALDEMKKDEQSDSKLDDDGDNSTPIEPEQETTTTTEVKETKPMPPKRNNYPPCWFEDEITGEPLRWHLFVGVLYDSIKGRSLLSQSSRIGFTTDTAAPSTLPWRLRVHFTAYPTTLLPLEIPPSIESATDKETKNSQISSVMGKVFRNSLKQALFMQYSSAKVAMSVTKKSHEKMWDAILSTNFTLYHEVNVNLQVGVTSSCVSEPVPVTSGAAMTKDAKSNVPELIPVRVMFNDNPPLQRPCRAFLDANAANEESYSEIDTEDNEKTLDNLVKHLSTCSIRPHTTLGDVLLSWLPHYFEKNIAEGVVPAPSVYYCIQGIQSSLSCPILDLWRSLCHPDHFLYIIVVTKV